MRRVEECVAWVVYVSSDRASHGRQVVCEQNEWDGMERERPGHHRLVKAGITSEREAELLARGTSGDAKPRQPKRPKGISAAAPQTSPP